MTPEALASLHPRLFHVTTPGAWPSIERHGLLPSAALLDLFETDPARRLQLATARRPDGVPIGNATGSAVLTDNRPLAEAALARCLDDGLTPTDWLRMLNERVFFWADAARMQGLLGARANRERAREVLVLDTLSVARAHAGAIELCPINSGSTIRRPARRGLATFAPMLSVEYVDWRRRRGGRGADRIVEIVLRGRLADPSRHLIARLPGHRQHEAVIVPKS